MQEPAGQWPAGGFMDLKPPAVWAGAYIVALGAYIMQGRPGEADAQAKEHATKAAKAFRDVGQRS